MKWKLQILLVSLIVALLAANHVEHYLRAERIRQLAQEQEIPVVHVASNAAGHTSIQIDEQSLAKGGYLYFNTLESWQYDKDRPAPCPQKVSDANGRKVKLMGFMYPLQEAGDLKTFCLLRSTQTCCYGPRPQYNQYVFVEMPQPVKFERLSPVVVEGRFMVDPKPDEGYIYRMEGASIRSAVANDQPVSATDFANQNNLPIFDFAPLETAKAATDKEAEIARLAAEIDGKPMVVSGFIVGKTQDSPAKFMIGKYAWDGKTKGTPPGLYNAVLVSLKDPAQSPPVWWQEAVFKGTVHVTKEPSQRSKNGIVSLQDATLAVAPAGVMADTGPIFPPLYEFMILAGYAGIVLMGFVSKRSAARRSSTTSGEAK